MKRTKKGFTLIELVVVIAVLAILAAIAFPVITNIVGDSKDKVDIANAKTIETAIKIYATQNSDTAIDKDDAKKALDNASVGNIQTQNANEFVYDNATKTVKVEAKGSATQVDETAYPDIYVK